MSSFVRKKGVLEEDSSFPYNSVIALEHKPD